MSVAHDILSHYLFGRALGGSTNYPPHASPVLPVISIDALESAYPVQSDLIAIRDQVLLGFLPHRPNTILSILNPERAAAHEHDSVSQDAVEMDTTLLWSFHHDSLQLQSYVSGWKESLGTIKTMIKCFTAVIEPEDTLIQITVYCSDFEAGIGSVMLRSASNISSSSGRQWNVGTSTCSTFEAPTASVCFSRVRHYIPVLLRTRCLFFLTSTAAHPSESKSKFWTSEVVDNQVVRIFEFDLFVEQLLSLQTLSFGNGTTQKWTYQTIYDTRALDVLQASLTKAAARHDHHVSDWGIFFIVGVLADDCKSVLLLSIYVDPLAFDNQFKSSLVLEAKRLSFKTKIVPGVTDVLRQAITKTYGLPDKHDCKRTCNPTLSGVHLMADYLRDETLSVDQIEGEYWHISGRGWVNDGVSNQT